MAIAIKSKIPINRDITMKRGMRWTQTIKIKENDGVTPKDTTGYTATMVIRQSPNGEIYKTLTIGDGITHTAAQGQFVFLITAAQIAALNFSTAEFEITFTPSGSEPVIPEYGNVTMIP